MPSIALITTHARYPWLRQMPGGGDTLDGWRFTLNEIAADCALVVVYDDPGKVICTHVPRNRRVVILSEPPGITTYRPAYLEQFGTVLGPIDPNLSSRKGYSGRWIASQPALPWFFGVGFGPDGLRVNMDMAALTALPPPEKINAISVVISSKTQLPKHRARLEFVEALQQRLGDKLHVFGRGFRAIDDKSEAILPYAYHLVLENNDIEHFWTEKTADAYLGWAFPVFSGCANLGAYMPEGSFIPVDIAAQEHTISTIEALLAADTYAARLPAITTARQRLLHDCNIFPVLIQCLAGIDAPPALMETHINLRCNRDFSLKNRAIAMVKALKG